MNFLKVTDLNNIPAASENTIIIEDGHSKGSKAEITGFWIFGGGRVAIDMGNRLHCLNDIILKDDKTIKLSPMSVAGVYHSKFRYDGNGLNDLEFRVTLNEGETIEDVYETILKVKRERITRLKAEKLQKEAA